MSEKTLFWLGVGLVAFGLIQYAKSKGANSPGVAGTGGPTGIASPPSNDGTTDDQTYDEFFGA